MMKASEFIKSPAVKKVLKIASTAVAVAVAVSGVISEQKQAEEFENLKKAVSDLQNK